jgi:RNA polymerase sigma factor (sigma-70 family)
MERRLANLGFRHIRTLYTLGALGGLTDAELLEIFLTRDGEDAEDAFGALVHRHGPMVLGVCRRMLPGSHDAEDSFQATFLILVRRGAWIGRREQLANWLYGVAVRTAKQAKRRAARHQARERRLMETTSQVDPAPAVDRAELLSLLDEELNRLPRHYRAALVACELEGKARREAALQLGLPEGTLSAHLARGRKLLHKRLVRRGICLGVGPFAGLPRQIAVVRVPERLAGSTIRAARGYPAGGTSAGAVAALVEGGLKMIFLTRLTLLVAAISATGMAAVTAGVAWSAIPTRHNEPPTAQVAPKGDNRTAVAKDKQTGKPLVVALDDCDEDYGEDRPHQDGLRIIEESGNQDDSRTVSFKEFNTCQTIGAIHCVAIDPARGRIYLSELVGGRVTALDIRGRKLWQVDKIEARALAVDPKTGNIWCAGGTTMVLDTTGREVMNVFVFGVDIAYDPKTDCFWVVCDGITKLSREGKALFDKPCNGWKCVSVAANPRDGSVWIVERKHEQVATSINRLWHLDANGAPIKTWELGDKRIFGVACDPRTGMAWVSNLRTELLRFTADGKELPALPVKAIAVAVSPTSRRVWVTTETEVLGLDDNGLPVMRFAWGDGARSGQSWLAAF